MSSLVSIIIPCYNAEAWVANAIESALSQTWQDIEVIAINDGSRDSSLSVLRRFAGAKVVVIDQPNRGAAAARNAGLRAAKGDFIQFLDADDLLTPTKIANQVTLLGRRGSGVVSTGRWARFRNHPGEAKIVESPLFADMKPIDFLLLYTAGWHMMHPAAWLVPFAVAQTAGPWDETLSLNDDGEYFARVALAAQQIVFAADSLSLYRSQVPQSLSSRRDRRALESLCRSCELIAAYIEKAEDSPRVRQALADHFQRLAYELYPDAPDLIKRAKVNVNAFGGSTLRPPMGPRQTWLARFVGWRLTRRAAMFFSR